jgi:Tol biopolymer transport system component
VSVTGNISGSAARLVRHRLGDGSTTTLLWSPESSLVVDRWPGRGVVFDARSPRENLRETVGGDTRLLSRGTATDRQPVYAHDGEHVIFSSNRGGANLDVWAVHRTTGATRRLTDDPADDWDPSLTPDGRTLLWSSNRSGNYEIWMADADGAHPRQVTHDGVDAENPTATPDAQWIAFSSGAPGRSGLWRVRPDGSDAALLVPDVILPEVSPDGTHVLFQTNRSPRVAVVGVATLVDGKVLPFQIHIDVRRPTLAILGRAHWMPDGHAIAFVGQDEHGVNGVFVQRFAADEDTSATRVPLAGFDPEHLTESFAVAPGLGAVVLAEWEQRTEIMAATGFDP